MQTIILTLVFSFLCSAGFGVGFRISPKELYNTVVSFVTASYGDLAANAAQLAQALLGIALGASIVPLFFQSKDYWRQLRKVKI